MENLKSTTRNNREENSLKFVRKKAKPFTENGSSYYRCLNKWSLRIALLSTILAAFSHFCFAWDIALFFCYLAAVGIVFTLITSVFEVLFGREKGKAVSYILVSLGLACLCFGTYGCYELEKALTF